MNHNLSPFPDSGLVTPSNLSQPRSPAQPSSPYGQHHGMGPLMGRQGGMLPLSAVKPPGGADGLDMELFDIFQMASTSFDTDQPAVPMQEYFSHAFPSASPAPHSSLSPTPAAPGNGSSAAAAAAASSMHPGHMQGSHAHWSALNLNLPASNAAALPPNPFAGYAAAQGMPQPLQPQPSQQQLQQQLQQLQQQQQQQQQQQNPHSASPSPQHQQLQQMSLSMPLADANLQAQMTQQQQQQQRRLAFLHMQAAAAAGAVPSNNAASSAAAAAASASAAAASSSAMGGLNSALAGLSAEQQQRMYADFISGANVNVFSAPFAAAAASAAAASSAAAGVAAVAPSVQSQYRSAAHPSSAMSSDVSDPDDDSDEDHPAGRKRSRVKLESTPASAHFNSPYYKGDAAGNYADLQPGEDPNDKNRLTKRLARKAELARASRRRKKMYVQDLESKVRKLGAKIEDMQSRASAESNNKAKSGARDPAEEEQRKAAQQAIRATLSELLNRPEAEQAAGTPAGEQIQALVRQFVDNSRSRQALVELHLDRVEESLTPGLQAKFAMWGLDQADDFYTKPGLWTSLMSKEIGLTDVQLASILNKRAAIHQERKNLAHCESMIRELRVAAGSHLRSLHHTMDDIQSVMTPTQLAKFCMWVESNEWTMQMLNSYMFTSSSAKAQQQP